MNKQRYIALLKNPSEVTKDDIPDITELINQFPYCQNAHILLAKVQTEVGSMHAAKLARKAALYTSDRAKLKNLLQPQELITSNQIEAQATSKLILQEHVSNNILHQNIEKISDEVDNTDTTTISVSALIVPLKETDLLPQHVEKPHVDTTVNIKYEADKKANDFLKELEENLLALKESKARAAGLLPPIRKPEESTSTVFNSISTETDIQTTTSAIVEEKFLDVIDKDVVSFLPIETPESMPDVVQSSTPLLITDTKEDVIERAKEVVLPQDEMPKKSYAGLIEAEAPTRDRAKSNDVLDLIMSFDNRVKDYFNINEYASKQLDSPKNEENADATPNQSVEKAIESTFEIPFTNTDWKLAESRLEEQGEANEESLLLNYLAYLKEQKNKVVKPDKKREKSIISRFIQKDPIISPLSYTEASKEEDEDSGSESSQSQSKPTFVSETFAKLLEKQGKIEKAIRVYEELILKNPEKNSYFATRIQELKKKI